MPMDDAYTLNETETHGVKVEKDTTPLRPVQGSLPSLPPKPKLPKDSGFADFGPEPAPFRNIKYGW